MASSNPFRGAARAWLVEYRGHMQTQLALVAKSRSAPSGGSESLMTWDEIVKTIRLVNEEIDRIDAEAAGTAAPSNGVQFLTIVPNGLT